MQRHFPLWTAAIVLAAAQPSLAVAAARGDGALPRRAEATMWYLAAGAPQGHFRVAYGEQQRVHPAARPTASVPLRAALNDKSPPAGGATSRRSRFARYAAPMCASPSVPGESAYTSRVERGSVAAKHSRARALRASSSCGSVDAALMLIARGDPRAACQLTALARVEPAAARVDAELCPPRQGRTGLEKTATFQRCEAASSGTGCCVDDPSAAGVDRCGRNG